MKPGLVLEEPEPSPRERTISMLEGLDDMMTDLLIKTNIVSAHSVSQQLTTKISHNLKWITANLDLNVICKLIDENKGLEHGEAIKELLRRPEFNVQAYH